MSTNTTYRFMSRKELAIAGDVSERTLYSYIQSEWPQLKAMGCKSRKKLTPAGVQYICENYGINLK